METQHTWHLNWSFPRVSLAGALLLFGSIQPSAQSQPATASQAAQYELNEAHFHITNYVQQGTDIHDFLKIMDTRVGRVAIFGIPVEQQWSYQNSGDFAPTYYLQSDAPLYYYSFADAHIAMATIHFRKKSSGALIR
jgi:hypothetical protein